MISFMFTDEELVQKIRFGDLSAEEELVKRYSKLVRICSRPYFLAGGDSEDLFQEGMFGLLSAIRKYDIFGGASFKTYAEQCIRNRIISAVESAARFKHTPLNDGISFEFLAEQNSSEFQLSADNLYSRLTEDQVLAKEYNTEIAEQRCKLLSRMEKQVLNMYLDGLSYKEIAQGLNKSEKSIDNAIQRIRKKFAQNNKSDIRLYLSHIEKEEN